MPIRSQLGATMMKTWVLALTSVASFMISLDSQVERGNAAADEFDGGSCD
jgi:hypothetical protein